MRIESPQNEKLKTVKRLGERRHRDREGMFATEGEDLLAAGLEAGHQPVFSLVAPDAGVDGIECDPDLLGAVSTLGSGTRVISVWETFDSGEPRTPCVYLEGVGDPGNVGTILRTCAALTGGSVCVGPGSADPFSPKAVRASMGAIFDSPPIRGRDLRDLPAPRTALAAHGGEALDALRGTSTLVVGAERAGVSEQAMEQCDHAVTIPTVEGVESLNVGAAAAIALHLLASESEDD